MPKPTHCRSPTATGGRSKPFKAYRRVSDEATAVMSAAATTGRQDWFDAAFHEVHTMFDNNATLNELHAAGIICDAR